MSPARWEPPTWGPPGIALENRHFEENVDKRKRICLENFAMPDGIKATALYKICLIRSTTMKSVYVDVKTSFKRKTRKYIVSISTSALN